jgi:hypothetical protein
MGILHDHRIIHKRMDTVVAFTREYFRVSISSGNAKCREPELIRPGDMMTKDRKARVDFG